MLRWPSFLYTLYAARLRRACPPELIRAALARIGDVEEYLTAHGLAPDAVTRLRTALVER